LAATNLHKRLLTAFLLIPAVMLAAWFDEPLPWLTLGAAIWGCVALIEFFTLVKNNNPRITPLTVFGVIWTTAFIISPHLAVDLVHPAVLSLGIVASLIWLVFKPNRETAFLSWVWTVAGVLYVGLLLSHLVALRLLPDGTGWVFLALLTTFASDSTAFFTGSILRGPRMAPSISPNKTWSGAFGGLAGGMIAAPIVVSIFNLPMGWTEAAFLGILVSIFGQTGDLAESLFKRNVKAKDSGVAVPGHGGCLDRMDSVVFGAIVVYYYVVWLV